MNYTITLESFDSLASYWHEFRNSLRWDCVFVSPPWLEVWWQEFRPTGELYLGTVRQKETIIGIAPLLLKEEEAFFLGSHDVCDCLDFIVAPGKEYYFFQTLFEDLKYKGIHRLKLSPLRPDSITYTCLTSIAEDLRFEVSYSLEDVSLELDLPLTWEGYMDILTQKQRHEVRRKLRRLEKAGDIKYRIIEEPEAIPDAIDIFLKLLRESKEDKAAFMNAQRESFFRSLARAMAQYQLLRLSILELDALPVATTMCFDYNNIVYLYNSGYNSQLSPLSVGMISKVLCIKDSIEGKRGRFDFLKGAEAYKYHLGGKEIPLYSCEIVLN